MKFSTEVVKAFALAQRDAGVGLTIADASASCSVISPELYREFMKPYHEEIFRFLAERKIWSPSDQPA